MPTHHEDLQLIPIIKKNICSTMNAHQTHTIILLGDFNQDIKLIRRHKDQI